jgi:hypothetical protein
VAILIDAWKLFTKEFKEQRALADQRKNFDTITATNLSYPMLETLAKAVAKERPGFYTEVTIQGAVIRMGIAENAAQQPPRVPDERF